MADNNSKLESKQPPEANKSGPNSVLFQARRYEDHPNHVASPYNCPYCREGELRFDSAPALLAHAQSFHPPIAAQSPDGSPWKQYLYDSAKKANRANHQLPFSFSPIGYDGHMKFGNPSLHSRDQPLYPHPTPSRVASGLNVLSLDSVDGGLPSKRPTISAAAAAAAAARYAYHRPFPPRQAQSIGGVGAGTTAPPAGIAAPLPPPAPPPPSQLPQTPALHTDGHDRKETHGAGRAGAQHKRSSKDAFIESSAHDPVTDGRKHRRLSKHDRRGKPTAQTGDEHLNAERCIECSRRGQPCEKGPNEESCRTCLADKLECSPMDRQSNRAVAPHSTQGIEAASAMSSSAESCNESLPDSLTETLDGEPGATQQDDTHVEVLLQPQTKPITLSQLETEVSTIHEAVERYENKCKEEYAAKLAAARLPAEKRLVWQQEDYSTYIGRHKSFMQETHDLCLATQHPVASPALRALPRRINVPARMWQFGIASPLEILRMNLPDAREHAVTFILIAFNMMTLFLETVPDFEGTWLECIGDLARYRLGLAETDEEKEVFSSIATYWFRRALDLNPQIGRLRHHLAVLVPNFSVEQLSLYGHALTAYTPFFAARKSVVASLRPVLDEGDQLPGRVPPMSLALLRAHASLFIGGPGALALFNRSVEELVGHLFDDFVKRAPKEKIGLKRFGCHIAISNSAALFEYGATTESNHDRSILRYAFLTRHVARAQALHAQNRPFEEQQQPEQQQKKKPIVPGGDDVVSRLTISHACTLTFGMLAVALRRPKDENLHPMIHVSFVMVWAFTSVPLAIEETESRIPWQELVDFLNVWANALTMTSQICSPYFPHNKPDRGQALPEDFMIQGLWYTQDYFPPRWCDNSNLDQQERLIEKEDYVAPRIERILWLGFGVATHNKWISYDRDTKSFKCNFTSSISQIYRTEPELEQLYQPEPQAAPQMTPNTWSGGQQPTYSPSQPGFGLQVNPHGHRLMALAQKWEQFKPQCDMFLANPPSRQDVAVRQQRRLGETIAKDFVAVLDTIGNVDDDAGGGAGGGDTNPSQTGNKSRSGGNSDNTYGDNGNVGDNSIESRKEALRQGMLAMIRKINQSGQGKRQSGSFEIYHDGMGT